MLRALQKFVVIMLSLGLIMFGLFKVYGNIDRHLKRQAVKQATKRIQSETKELEVYVYEQGIKATEKQLDAIKRKVRD